MVSKSMVCKDRKFSLKGISSALLLSHAPHGSYPTVLCLRPGLVRGKLKMGAFNDGWGKALSSYPAIIKNSALTSTSNAVRSICCYTIEFDTFNVC